MKMNTLPKLANCLETGGPEIIMDDKIIDQARVPIERMLDWS